MSTSRTGQMYISPTKLSYKILKWMQEHEDTNKLKHTTGLKLAEEIVNLPGVDTGEITIEQTISKMIKRKVIYRDKEEKSLYSDFRINYWHKSIPAEILDNAPASVKRAMAKVNKIINKVVEQPTTQEVNVPLEIKKDGKQITVNLSLTINL